MSNLPFLFSVLGRYLRVVLDPSEFPHPDLAGPPAWAPTHLAADCWPGARRGNRSAIVIDGDHDRSTLRSDAGLFDSVYPTVVRLHSVAHMIVHAVEPEIASWIPTPR